MSRFGAMFESAGVHQHGVTAVKRFVLDGSRNQFVAQACAVLGVQSPTELISE